MDDAASRVEKTMTPITAAQLTRQGATVGEDGVWTFPDGSKGKLTERPVPVYSDEQQTERLGSAYFERID